MEIISFYITLYKPVYPRKKMESENIYSKIRELFGQIPDNLNILQEQINIDLQMEYYEMAGRRKHASVNEPFYGNRNELLSPDCPVEDKKELLLQLAAVEKIEVYRLIEKYLENPDPELKDWAMLALQENRMLLETRLLDQNQIFISTGLGGKGSLLRYFIVLLSRKRTPFSETQAKFIRSEFEFLLKQNLSELENIQFYDKFVTMNVLIPLHITIKDLFRQGIDECNQYGNFLRTNFMVTNVKSLTAEEIRYFLEKRKRKKKSVKKA